MNYPGGPADFGADIPTYQLHDASGMNPLDINPMLNLPTPSGSDLVYLDEYGAGPDHHMTIVEKGTVLLGTLYFFGLFVGNAKGLIRGVKFSQGEPLGKRFSFTFNNMGKYGMRIGNGVAITVVSITVFQSAFAALRQREDHWNVVFGASTFWGLIRMQGGFPVGVMHGLGALGFFMWTFWMASVCKGDRLPWISETVSPVWQIIKWGNVVRMVSKEAFNYDLGSYNTPWGVRNHH